jgi:hypothetical protein
LPDLITGEGEDEAVWELWLVTPAVLTMMVTGRSEDGNDVIPTAETVSSAVSAVRARSPGRIDQGSP